MESKSSLNEKFNLIANGFSTDPFFYWITFLKYKKQLIIIPILISLIALFISKNIQPTFRSTASLIIDNQENNIINIEQVYSENQNSLNNYSFINTQKQIILSNEITDRIFSNENFKKNFQKKYNSYEPTFLKSIYSFFKTEEKTINENFYKNYTRDNLNVVTNKDNNVLSLYFDSKSKDLSRIVLEEIIQAYLEYDIDQKISVTTYANTKISERLDELKLNLSESEKNLQNYKKENKLIDLGDIKNLKNEEIKSISNRILKAEKELQSLQNDLQQVSLAGEDVEELVSLKIIREEKEVDKILSDLKANDNTIDSLKLVYTENHPKLQKAFKTKANLDSKLDTIINNNIASLAYEMANLENFIALSEIELGKAREELQDLEIKDLDMQKYSREVDLNKRIYESFLERLKETSEARELQTPNAKILDKPLTIEKPISPKTDLITFLTFACTLFILYGLVCYYETFRNVVSDPTDLESNNFNFLNVIPKTLPKKGYHLPFNFLEKNSDPFSESILSMQTLLLSKYNASKVFMFTSPVSGEGKTTLSLNFALSLSIRKKVLFLETDLRRPSLIKSLNLDHRPGLIELLNGDVNYSEILLNIYSSRLDVIPAGNPNKFNKTIDQSKIGNFIKLLKTQYDYIVLDTAPVLPVADTLAISNIADTTIFVVRSEYTKTAGLINARKKIEQVSDCNVVTVMNFFDYQKANYYNYSNYGYNYKNYYNYSNS